MEIIQFLSKYHGKVISERTLHRRLREYGLNRRTPRYDIDEIEEVRQLLDGPECLVGYRHIWHTLQKTQSPSSLFCCTGINAVFGS